jgi:hypothetical protein
MTGDSISFRVPHLVWNLPCRSRPVMQRSIISCSMYRVLHSFSSSVHGLQQRPIEIPVPDDTAE